MSVVIIDGTRIDVDDKKVNALADKITFEGRKATDRSNFAFKRRIWNAINGAEIRGDKKPLAYFQSIQARMNELKGLKRRAAKSTGDYDKTVRRWGNS